jgi:hypothetical protein
MLRIKLGLSAAEQSLITQKEQQVPPLRFAPVGMKIL